MKVLLDTSYLIDLLKNKKFSEFLRKHDVYISEITLYEIIRGEYYVNPSKAKKLKELLEAVVKVIKLDNDIILKASEIYSELRKSGSMIDEADIIIGATGIVKNIEIATKDIKHLKRLERFGLKIMSNTLE